MLLWGLGRRCPGWGRGVGLWCFGCLLLSWFSRCFDFGEVESELLTLLMLLSAASDGNLDGRGWLVEGLTMTVYLGSVRAS